MMREQGLVSVLLASPSEVLTHMKYSAWGKSPWAGDFHPE